jgi:hypothetical protein
MFVSLNEVESTVRKAFRGSDYHWGEAEEAGKAAVWLVRRKLPVMEPFLRLLRSLDGSPESLRPIVSADIWRSASGRLCPILTGISLADAAMELKIGGNMRFENVLTPILLAPFASLAADTRQLNLSLHWPGNEIIVQGHEFDGDLVNAEEPATIILTVRPPDGTFEAATSGEERTMEVDSGLWAELNRFAAETYVPASARSRAVGAGAGLTDND